MGKTAILRIVGVSLVVLTGSVFARVISVPAEYGTIQGAIDDCNEADTVIVSADTYSEDISFNGTNITVRSTNPDDPAVVEATIIQGTGTGSVVTFSGSEGASCVLEGLTITGGNTPYFGGGIYGDYTGATIRNCIIRNNRSEVAGGGLAMCYGPVSKCIIRDNSSGEGGDGGGVAFCNGPISNCTIRDNSGNRGGGLKSCYGPISNCLIQGNSAYSRGGGLWMCGSPISNCTITYNSAYWGGGLDDCDGPIRNCRITDNRAYEYGSGLENCGGPISRCTIAGNFGSWSAGVSNCPGTISNCIIWGNRPRQLNDCSEPTYSCVGSGGSPGIGNISDDPCFVNPSADDYHLQVYSPCINAGDPGFGAEPNETDIDGEARVFAGRVDMGSDEYIGHLMPIADAGPDQYFEEAQLVTLDGSGSFFYDPCGLMEFAWTQIAGPNVELGDSTAIQPTFVPAVKAEYRFELVVRDDVFTSYPDAVLVVVGNRPPVADAGRDRLCRVGEQVNLDGSGSYDPDPGNELTYMWAQVQGPNAVLFGASSARPYFHCNEWGLYEFELIVSDGQDDSQPGRVQAANVDVGIQEQELNVRYDGGMNYNYPDISGNKVVYASNFACPLSWDLKCKDMSTGHVYIFEGGGIHAQPEIEGDLIVHFGAKSQDEPIRIEAYDRSSISYYQIPDLEPHTLKGYTATESYSHPAISGTKVVWLEHLNLDPSGAPGYNLPYNICGADVTTIDDPVFLTIAANVGSRDVTGGAIYEFDNVVDIWGNIVVWEGDGDIYGADISDLNDIKVFPICTHPARQFDPAVSRNIVVWTDERNDGGDIYGAYINDVEDIEAFEIVEANGTQEQPAIEGRMVVYVDFVNPIEGDIGEIKACYLTRKHGALATPLLERRYGVGPAMDGHNIVWQGRHSYDGLAEGISLEVVYAIADGPIENPAYGARYDFFAHAILEAEPGHEIVAEPGTYDEDIDFKGKNLTVRSVDPHDAAVRATTVIRGCGQEPVVSFSYADYGGPPCVLSGLTITDGNTGIYCSGACPTIANCNIVANRGPGIEWWTSLACRYPIVANCTVAENQGPGMLFPVRGNPSIINCVIAGNGENGIYARSPWMTNCTVVGNKLWGVTGVGGKVANCIIRDNAAGAIESSPLVSYSNIEGGCEGQGNVDVDPCFGVNGYWDAEVWMEGDYHLRFNSPCIDSGDNNSVPSDTADLDGDGNTTEPMPWDLGGRDRLADGDCNDTDIVDMGAYEFAYAYIGDFDGQCDVDFEDFALFALAWLSGEGEGRYNPNCDISIPSDKFIDWRDLDVVSENWLGAL